MCAVRRFNQIGRRSMTTVYTNGQPIIQGQFDIDLGEQEVTIAGEPIPLTAALESLLFVAAQPVTAAQLADALELTMELVVHTLEQLAEQYQQRNQGLRLQVRDEQYQLVTVPAAAALIERFLTLDLTTKLSGPALEALAVIAYRQPVTRAQIEAVRGVDSAGVLRSLLQRGLIEEIGRLEVAGRPILYGVTDSFLQHFGLTSLAQLPPLTDPDAELLASATQLAALESRA
jgi:segregation and condensation protein B